MEEITYNDIIEKMIPDKIYVPVYGDITFSSPWTFAPLEDEKHEEYIRKDALMEWTKEKLQERHAFQFRDALGQLIDKLNLI